MQHFENVQSYSITYFSNWSIKHKHQKANTDFNMALLVHTLSLPMGKGMAVQRFFLPSYTGFRSPKICVLKCWTMCSTISLQKKKVSINVLPNNQLKFQVCQKMLPVNSPWAFLRLYIYVVMVHLQLGYFHFKEVGLKLDCSTHCAKVWPLRWFEDILLCWRRQWSYGTHTFLTLIRNTTFF